MLLREASNLGTEEKGANAVIASDFESEASADDGLEDFCEQSLWFVLSHCTCIQLANLLSHCLFTSHLAVSERRAKKLGLEWSERQGDLVMIDPQELNKRLTSVAVNSNMITHTDYHHTDTH